MKREDKNRMLISRYYGDPENYQRLHTICVQVFRRADDGEDALHNIYEKLYTEAEKIHFPKNREEVLPYMQRVIRNYHKDWLTPHKITIESLEHAEELADVDAVKPFKEKLSEVNDYVLHHPQLLTQKQHQLWDCVYAMHSTPELMQDLHKEADAISKLRYKLFVKLREAMAHDRHAA
jgi:DNA-directed RNA polymerase specialized sigma24 family protein